MRRSLLQFGLHDLMLLPLSNECVLSFCGFGHKISLMIRILIPVAVALAIGTTNLRAQDPAVVNPTSISVKLENDSVRVLEAVLEPGFKEKLHAHPAYVMYILSGGKVRLHYTDGQFRDSEFKAGAVFYSDPVTHWAENTGTTTIKVLLVELKRK